MTDEQITNLKKILEHLTKRNEGIVSRIANMCLYGALPNSLYEGHDLVVELHWQMTESKFKDNSTFTPELKEMVVDYITKFK